MNLLTRTLIALIVFIILAAGVQPGQAQDASTNECTRLVQNALSQLGNNCGDLGQNRACYGFRSVQSQLEAGTDAQPLSQPADQVNLTSVAVIDASAFNLSSGAWGIGVIKTAANLPVALRGQNLILIPLGDVEVENGVEPAEALLLPEISLPVAVGAATELFLEPTANSEVVGQVAGTTLDADGISPDRKWLRVYFEHEREYSIRATAWIGIEGLEPTPDTSGLPVIHPDSLTPMQKFYLRNAFTTPDCKLVPPPVLLVQGPEGIETDFIANGAKIRISSTITLRLLPPGNLMELAVLSGIATLNPDTSNPIIVPAGFATSICLSEERNLGIDGEPNDREVIAGCSWGALRMLRQDELLGLSSLQNIPSSVLNYRFRLPVLVCPSGVGRPICKIMIDNPKLIETLRRLCALKWLPDAVCPFIGGL